MARLGKKAQKQRVLLLDDDVDLCAVLKSLLEWEGYEVSAVQRGVDGLREIMAQDFDVIVSDMFMPSMQGDMFFLAVCKTKAYMRSRFLLITASRDSHVVTDFLAKENVSVLYKPIATHDLIEKIEETIRVANEKAPLPVKVEPVPKAVGGPSEPVEPKRVRMPKTAAAERLSD